MADFEDDTLELTEELEAHEADSEDLEQQDDAESEGEEAPDDEDEFIAFEDEESPASGDADTGLVKHLRAQLKEQRRELEVLRRTSPQPQVIEVGEEPTMESCDFDEEAFKNALFAWKERKAKAEAQAQEAEQAAKQANEAWAEEVRGYHRQKAALKFADVQEAEDTVLATLGDIQQRVIVKAASNPAMVIYALGKHPAKLAEISKITDPIKLAVAVSKLEGKMSVKKRGGPPEPERIARGSAPVAQASDKHLERLEKEADRTGDRSKLVAYKAKLKAQAK